MSPGGVIYALGAVGTSYVKIGSTTLAVEVRRKQLQTGQPFRLQILAAIAVDGDIGAIEKYIQGLLAESLYGGEWFDTAIDSVRLAALVQQAREALARTTGLSLGQKTYRLRVARKLSQVELAERVGVRQSFISKLEAGGQTNPGAVALKGLAKALGCTTDYLVGMHEDEKDSELVPTAVA